MSVWEQVLSWTILGSWVLIYCWCVIHPVQGPPRPTPLADEVEHWLRRISA